jgi:hypothetical protein
MGCSFTALVLRGRAAHVLHAVTAHISIPRGAWRDNVVVERLWRSVKYEEVYLKAYGNVGEARGCIGRYLGKARLLPRYL